MPTWNPSRYLQFADERSQPCRDLVARIALENPRRIIDLGCGPGNSTAVLAQRWPEAKILGLDSSPHMITAAQQTSDRIHWEVGDIATTSPKVPYDLVFSNAALQWVPDHTVVYPHLLNQVASGGALAIQVPANIDAPAHQAMRDIASLPEWKTHFAGAVREWFVHEPPFYYDLLAPLVTKLDLWVTEYMHIMAGPEAIVEWYKGTGLRPFLDLLPDEETKGRFLAEYLHRIEKVYPRQADSRVVFPFRRLFLIAYR